MRPAPKAAPTFAPAGYEVEPRHQRAELPADGESSTAKLAISGGAQLATTASSDGNSCFPAALHAQEEPPCQEPP